MNPGRFPFEKLAKYPHMKPEDVLVWERFIEQNPDYFDRVDYDMPCGKGAPQDPDLPENIQYDGKILTQKKIDVIGYNGEVCTIVEVGPIANMRKLGQIMAYKALYCMDHPDVWLPQSLVICGSVERELGDIFKENGIEIKIA